MVDYKEKSGKVKGTPILDYLISLAEHHFIEKVDSTRDYALGKGYKYIRYRYKKSVLSTYLGLKQPSAYSGSDLYFFPFGCNASQYQAVINALDNQVSIIEGPPGTGKTQTILNIIANLLIQGKTIQVVSNNNEAIRNIQEKLGKPKYELDFIVAMLGSKENQDTFHEQLRKRDFTSLREKMKGWELSNYQKQECLERVQSCSRKIHRIFELSTRQAQILQELCQIELEYKHYRLERDVSNKVKSDAIGKLNESKLLSFLANYRHRLSSSGAIGLWTKLLWTVRYRVWKWEIYNESPDELIPALQLDYYQKRRQSLAVELGNIKQKLRELKHDEILSELEEQSLLYLKGLVARNYLEYPQVHYSKGTFIAQDKSKSKHFLQRFPIVLSTTFSSASNINGEVGFDYVIMDEASQIDIVTGAQAMSTARNMVIVGDSKQLPNIVTQNQLKEWEPIFEESKLSDVYSPKLSLIDSIARLMPQVPRQLLREHYRCHPKIINFCNQEFYNGELIIMTEDKGENDVMVVYRTVPGNHNRKNYNQRQIDVLKQEIIGKYNLNPESTGTISPFRKHNRHQSEQLDNYTIDTVHKFQGREKDNIVFSTVVDHHNEFVSDKKLVNVAVSRAKRRFILVMTGNELIEDSTITHLADYIRYHDLTVEESQVTSIYDYLYKQYEREWKTILANYKGRVTEKSEILTDQLLEKILSEDAYSSMGYASHYLLCDLVSPLQMTKLSIKEQQFVASGSSHIDFLIYGRTSKKAVLAIEVDGVRFHADSPEQLKRDAIKDSILKKIGITLLRLPTNGSGEEYKIRKKLDELIL